MSKRSNSSSLDVVILVANTFDEEETIKCLRIMRQAGLSTEIIGHRSGLITGASGMTVRPDRTLIDLDESAGIRLIIMPGKVPSAMALLVDPRVHRLFATVTASGGHLAIMSQAEKAFVRAGLLEILGDPSIVGQGQKDLITFSRNLINLLESEEK